MAKINRPSAPKIPAQPKKYAGRNNSRSSGEGRGEANPQNANKGYVDSGIAQSTQDANLPIDGTREMMVTPKLYIREINRSPKDVGTLQKALLTAENIYWPITQPLFDLYMEAIRDGHLAGIIRKRIAQVANKVLHFKKGDKIVEEMEDFLRGQNSATNKQPKNCKPIRKVIRELILRKVWGRRGMEFIPGKDLDFNIIPVKHINIKSQKIVIEQFSLEDGISYVDLKNIWVLGDHGDFGLLLEASYYALLKRGAIGDWATYIELFGSPTMIMKYKGYDLNAQKAAQKIINEAGNSMKLVIPEEFGFDMKDGKMSNGDGKLQETFRLAMNQEMSLIILGNTETSASGQHGSEGKSKTHADQQKELMKSDMDDVLDDLNSEHFMNILRSYGLPVDGGYFEFDKEVDIEYIKQFAPVVVSLATQVGQPMSKKWISDTFGIPIPEDASDTIQLFPTLGQQPTNDDPDKQDGQRSSPPSPNTQTHTQTKTRAGKKPTANLSDNAPATIADVKALFADFFGLAR